MQPYFFPYIGYFQLVNAVDKFVFYDDVKYINKGWINRNRILVNNDAHYLTIPLETASQNKLISEIFFIKNLDKQKKTIYYAYRKAPFFKDAWPVIERVLSLKDIGISKLAAFSVTEICKYIGIETVFEFSSNKYADTINLRKAERLIKICKINNADEYINPIGGEEIYSKEYFSDHGIDIFFLNSLPVYYKQLSSVFISNLSIIDVLMFNSKEQVRTLFKLYELI